MIIDLDRIIDESKFLGISAVDIARLRGMNGEFMNYKNIIHVQRVDSKEKDRALGIPINSNNG